jgi:hypothetical protein
MTTGGYAEKDMVEIRAHVNSMAYEIRQFVHERNGQIEAMIEKAFQEYLSRSEFAKEIAEQVRASMMQEINRTVGVLIDDMVRRWMTEKGNKQVAEISAKLWKQYYGLTK